MNLNSEKAPTDSDQGEAVTLRSKTFKKTWKGTVWFVEGDIKGCFDNIDHSYLMSLLEEKVKDTRLLKLIRQMLKAGYMEGLETI